MQKKLDIITNEVLIEANEWGGHLAAMASEEMDTIHVVPNRYPQGEYLLLFDPLDGSSNIDVNVTIGTIFSVLRKVGHHRGVSEEDFLQPGRAPGGRRLLRLRPADHAGADRGRRRGDVHARPRDGLVGADRQNRLQIPEDTKEFAINMSNMRHWAPPMTRYIDECLAGKERPARQGLQHALGGQHGGRRAPHPDAAAACSCTRGTSASPTSPASCA